MSGECEKCEEHCLDCQCNAKTAWFSIKDKLPESAGEVLVYVPEAKWTSHVTSAWFDGDVFWVEEDGAPLRGITHWMPLPTLPKDG